MNVIKLKLAGCSFGDIINESIVIIRAVIR